MLCDAFHQDLIEFWWKSGKGTSAHIYIIYHILGCIVKSLFLLHQIYCTKYAKLITYNRRLMISTSSLFFKSKFYFSQFSVLICDGSKFNSVHPKNKKEMSKKV